MDIGLCVCTTRSINDTVEVGTLNADHCMCPESSGIISSIACDAPVLVGMIESP
jgi:hypothetical protein